MDTTLSFAATAGAQFAQLDVEPWHWGGLLALIAAMLAVDLFLHRENHEPTTRHTLIESAVWVAFGLGFSVVVLGLFGGQAFGEYLSGYVIEKSLSVDNVFVWAVIFSTFAIPARCPAPRAVLEHVGALTLHAVFIFAGSTLIARFWWLLLVFGVALVASGVKVARPP